jgi:hypothetical protein
VKVRVCPAMAVLLLALLMMDRSATGLTVSVAVTTDVLVPSVVDKEPAGMVFTAVKVPLTTTEAEQEPPGGMTVEVLTTIELAPAIAVTELPFAHVVAGSGEAALNIPVGYASTNAELKVADVNAWVFVKVITSKVVAPALMVAVGV